MRRSRDRSHAIYVIQVQGELDADWEAYLGGLTVLPARRNRRPPLTTFTTDLVDQAALRGLLCKLWDLNLTLVSIRRIEADSRKEEADD
jgi:hypothetical protein